jgi:hypothetical protein
MFQVLQSFITRIVVVEVDDGKTADIPDDVLFCKERVVDAAFPVETTKVILDKG